MTGLISLSRFTTAFPFTIAESSGACPGLYFVGLPFLYSLSSILVGGVGRDAEYIVDHINSKIVER